MIVKKSSKRLKKCKRLKSKILGMMETWLGETDGLSQVLTNITTKHITNETNSQMEE